MIPPGRIYADPGDRLSGHYDLARPCVVTAQWRPGGGPRNVAVRYLDDGTAEVIPVHAQAAEPAPGPGASTRLP
jgi:hypothetical protein